MKVITSVARLFLVFSLFGCQKETRSSRFLIPAGYVGPIRVQYEIPNAPALKIENGRYLITIPPGGTAQTSSKLPTGWHDPEDFYYVKGSKRQRLPVKDEPYPVGMKSPAAMVRGGSVGSGTNMPVTEWWLIGTDKQIAAYFKKHGNRDWHK